MAGKTQPRRAAGSKSPRAPVLEWVTAAIGLVLLLGVIGVILADAAGGNDAGPEIVVDRLATRPAGRGWVVEFEARNIANAPAAHVQVTGVLAGPGQPERSSATIDYLPGGGAARGGLMFRSDPAGSVLELGADGYREP